MEMRMVKITKYQKLQRVGEGSESLSKRYRAEVLKEGPNDGQYTAKLTISAVTEEDAGTTNELSVTNELGTTIYPFTLSLGDKPAAGETVTISYHRCIFKYLNI